MKQFRTRWGFSWGRAASLRREALHEECEEVSKAFTDLEGETSVLDIEEAEIDRDQIF